MTTELIDAERCTLSAVMQDTEALIKANEIVTPQDFYSEKHQTIFKTCLDVYNAGQVVDLVTITDKLVQRDELKKCGGASYVAQVAAIMPTATSVKYHAELVRKAAVVRRVNLWAKKLAEQTDAGVENLGELFGTMQADIVSLADTVREKRSPMIKNIIVELSKQWDAFAGAKSESRQEKKTGKYCGVQLFKPVNAESPIPYFMPGHLWMLAGYCLGKGTEVICYNGERKKVEDIKCGDLLSPVWSKTPRRVIGLNNGIDDLYEISGKYIDPFVVNSAHVLPVMRIGSEYKNYKSGEVYYLSAKELHEKSPREMRGFKLIKEPAIFTKSINSCDIPPYLLGLWLGDGTSNKPEITVFHTENEIIEYLKQYSSENNFPFKVREDKRHKGVLTISFAINERGDISTRRHCFINKLRRIGVYKNKHIPESYQLASIDDRLHLLAGLIDTDGSYGRCGYVFYQQDKKFIDSVKRLADQLGFNTKLSLKDQSKSNKFIGNHLWRLSISGGVFDIPVRVKRKIRDKRSKMARSKPTLTFDIKHIGKGEFYGFELDGNHLFLASNCIVQHNTSAGKSTALAQLICDACSDGARVLGFSLEESRTTKAVKMIANITDIPQKYLLTGEIHVNQFDAVRQAMDLLNTWNVLWYDDVRTLDEICLKSKKHSMQGGVDIIAIDYVQNIQGNGDSIYNDMRAVGPRLLDLANELGATVVALSQVTNESMRGDSEIIGLKGAGELAAAADIVLWLKRVKGQSQLLDCEIRKNRAFGETGIMELQFSDRYTRVKRRAF